MSHFGMIFPDASGHLNPIMSLARELQCRGHQITFYQRPIGQPKVEQAGFTCRVYGAAEFPAEASLTARRRLAELQGIRGLLHTLEIFRGSAGAQLRELPKMIREDAVQALVIDQTMGAAPTIAEALQLPYAVISSIVPMQAEPTLPPFSMPWRYSTSRLAILRNQVAYRILGRLARPTRQLINEYRTQLGLVATSDVSGTYSPHAQICAIPAEFDFPRKHMPAYAHFTGPLTDPSVRPPTAFPFERLDGRPLVYASLGTMLNRQHHLLLRIAEACVGLNVQLVLSLGGATPEEVGKLPGDPIAVSFAPQLELLKRTTLCITHAGMNTTMECLAEGVPMVAIPIMNDQPGVAARIAWTGCGEFVPVRRVTVRTLRRLIRQVLDDPNYRQNAQRMRAAIQRAGGIQRAADIMESIPRSKP